MKDKIDYLEYPVWYLQNDDLDSDGNILPNENFDKDKTTIVFVQMERCGHCVASKPEFQKFANENKDKYNMCTIACHASKPQAGEKELCARVDKLIPGFEGYPTIVAFKNGRYSRINKIGRDVSSLEKFAASI